MKTENNVEFHSGYYLDNKKVMHTFAKSQKSILGGAGHTFLPPNLSSTPATKLRVPAEKASGSFFFTQQVKPTHFSRAQF